MDKIILGILILKRLTVYEIRGIIRQYFKSMCSDSLGSIQAAIKKLLSEQMITCQEYVEKGVNKKQYSITEKGRQSFLDWLHVPADVSNPKNMELSKLLFMGLVPNKERVRLIGETIALLEQELAGLENLKRSVTAINEEKVKMIAYWEHDTEYLNGIQSATKARDITESASDIGEFQLLTLQYGIDSTQFQIDWYRNLENKLKADDDEGII